MSLPNLILAQDPTEAISTTVLEGQRKAIEAEARLSEEQKTQALSKLDEATGLLEKAARAEVQADELQQRVRKAPEEIGKLKQAEPPSETFDPEQLATWTSEQLETALTEQQALLGDLQETLATNDRELTGYLSFARNGAADLAALQTQLSELDVPDEVAKDEQGTHLTIAAERLLIMAKQRELEARASLMRLQQNNLNLLTELSQLTRDLAASRVEDMTAQTSMLRERITQRRKADADAALAAASKALSESGEQTGSIQQKISDLAIEQTELIDRESEIDRRIEQVERQNEEIKRDHERIRQVMELGGATAQVSALLQKRRTLAPSPKTLTRRALNYQEAISDAALRQLTLDELLYETRGIEKQIQPLMDDMAAIPDYAEREQIRQALREAWTNYRQVLLTLWKDYTRYIGKLSTLEASTRDLIASTAAYRAFIDDRLLWMPSTEISPLDQPERLLSGLQWLVAPENIAQLLQNIPKVATEQSPALLLWLGLLIVIFIFRSNARQGLADAAQATQKVRTDSIRVTLHAIGHTLALILPWPLAFIGAGLLLGRVDAIDDYTAIISIGLQSVGHTLLFLGTLRHLCQTNGLGREHLSWDPVLCDQLGKTATWLLQFAAPLAFFITIGAATVPSAFVNLTTVLQTEQPGLISMGRLALIALTLLFAIAIYRVWRKKGAVMASFAESSERSQWPQYHIIWFIPAMLIPISLSLGALIGYFYTATFLAGKVGETVWFIIVLMFFKDLLLRGLYVAQRRLRFAEALRYREEAQAQREAGGETPASSELPLDEEKIDYGRLGSQARQLVRLGYTVGMLVGFWWIWQEVIPALNVFDRIPLPVSTTKMVDGVSTEIPLTLGDVFAGLLLGGLALFAARNIPALLELTLLQRLPLSRASRYAITTLTQYVVAMLGIVITFNALGLQWSSIQWLVAALSVGLGFGLQEIVANFISGIILLFEQPIRVGDVVTVEGTTGTVSRIRIRATTIVNWERQELVIPNKSFITGTLINWTLSDTVNRIIITVGVSYDTDTKQAMKLMKEAAEEHPRVIDDPAPLISFEAFGDNALNLLMRAYISDLDNRLVTMTELHQAILDKFRAADIEISFPQRDVHLDTNQPLELVLRKEARMPHGSS